MNWLPIIMVTAQVTLVAALGLLTARLLRGAAHRHTVLLAALLCMPASPLFYAAVGWLGLAVNLPTVFSGPSVSSPLAARTTDSNSDRQEKTPALSELPVQLLATPSSEATVPAVAAAIAATEAIQTPRPTNRWSWRAEDVVVGLWLAGTLMSFAGVLRSQWKTQLILKSARPVGHSIEAGVIVEAERRLNSVSRLRVATTGKVAGPAVAGVVQPWILIPVRYFEALSHEELLQILIHEGAHCLRRDPLIALLQRIVGALFWWHPLVHLVNCQLTHAREEICDNFVLGHTEPDIYGATLLRLATLSPAMARLPLAIGIFDDRAKLEERIRGLLDSRRIMRTRVRFVTVAAVLTVFALCSVVVAAARVSAQTPAEAPPVAEQHRQASPAKAVDTEAFSLVLTYHGETDKPFYDLILQIPHQGVLQTNPFVLAQRISEEQAEKLVQHLKESKFFEHAKVTQTQDDPTTGPQYLLRVRLGEQHFEETLGWDIGTVTRLHALRRTLDGDAAKLMDQLLVRLEGQRKVWESGEVIDDLKTTLSTENESYSAGRQIPIKLELTNVGQQDREYGHHLFIRSGSEIVVSDQHGRPVPYLGGGAGLMRREITIKPGETKVIESCDLSDFYYLRRPGLYTVGFRNVAVYNAGVPASNAVRFRVMADAGAEADGDPMGKLLPLVSANFELIGSPNASGKVRPGRNCQEAPGRQYIFVGPGGLKGSKAAVWLWLTDEVAKEIEPPPNDYLPPSEYRGKVSRWHLYLYTSPEALKLWPAVEQDLQAALTMNAEVTSAANADSATDDDYRRLHNRYRGEILEAAKAGNKEEIATLTDVFNASIGGQLLFTQVTLRAGPIADHATLFSKFFDSQRKLSIGKPNFAASAEPIVSQNHDGQGIVLVATNPLGGNKWPDDLQVTLAMDPVAKKEIRKPLAKPKWSDTKNGLRTRITAEKHSFPAGAAIPLKLEMENVGTQSWQYETPTAPHNDTLIVIDESGRPVPYLAGLSQVPVRLKELAPGAREELKAFDLSEAYYLRRPGRYSVRWPGGLALRGDAEAPIERANSPDTAPFEFDVTPSPEASADGDPIGRLLPLVKEKWWLSGTGKTVSVRPGGNREEVPGCVVFFHYNPTGYKADSGVVFLWLTEQSALEQPDQAKLPTASEYLGKVGRWHVYTFIDVIGSKAWPSANDDIKQALAAEPKFGALTVQ